MAAVQTQAEELPWFLRTSYPVLFPSHEALFNSYPEYDSFLVNELRGLHRVVSLESLEDSMDGVTLTAEEKKSIRKDWRNGDEKYFNLMLTANSDIAFRSTKSPVVDLFYELEDVVSGPRLKELLDAAWAEQPLATLKIIFNARSIHLGKSSKHVFYRAAGWLAEHHPLTLVGNLRWLSRPVIEKKVRKEGGKDAEEGFVKVEKRDGIENAADRFDVRYGVSHGYWKDLLNILALAAEKKLKVLEDPKDVLNVEDAAIKSKAISRRKQKQNATGTTSSGRTPKRIVKAKKAKVEKKEKELAEIKHVLEEKTVHIGNQSFAKHRARDARHEALKDFFDDNAFYRTLHITVARLFAEQLHADLEALRSSESKAKRGISLCAKWAPSQGNFHDRHTCVISSIAEILYSRESLGSAVFASTSREEYLRYAREQYRKDVSALRKHLEVVERDISANTFDKIKYDRLPSIAMKNYTSLFVKKDLDHFRGYINKVAEGKARISGAVLMPSTLIKAVSGLAVYDGRDLEGLTADELVDRTVKEIEAKAVNGQWKALVQRIKDSGTLSSCIAVCDVSGSMGSPTFSDKTTPMDSAVGLSLLVAEVTEPPFGGNFISFHSHPQMISIDTTKTLPEKVAQIKQSNWGFNTDFVAVFEKLILPTAIANNLKQEDMVKRVFVFSDMQFDQAEIEYSDEKKQDPWSASSYERIKEKYEEHGYEMPELVFWNLAGGRAGYTGGGGDETAPKPVLAEEMGTALVSGYSQGMLKVFMDNGMFDEKEEEEEEEEDDDFEKMDEEGNEEKKPEKVAKKKEKINPLSMVKKAISHKGYAMLEVLD